jgi:predicted nucleic acid-binding protein
MNADRAFLDTNVLVYVVTSDDPRKPAAQALIRPNTLVRMEVLNEFVAAGLKRRTPWADILKALRGFRALLEDPLPLRLETHFRALEIHQRGYHIYDSLIIASALEAGCSVLYSEDLHDGQTIDGLTICNPFR